MSTTLGHCAQRIERRLAEVRGFELPGEQAWLLVGVAAGLRSTTAREQADREIDAEGARFIETYLEAEPLVPVPLYTGRYDCGAITVRVTADTLLPGTETARFIEIASGLARSNEAKTVVEFGTGCGIVTVSLAAQAPDCRFVATDISAAALAVATGNVSSYGLERRVALLEGSWGDPLRQSSLTGRVDLVLSNPPYCEENALRDLPIGFREFAPALAINGGPDGLAGHRAVIDAASELLCDGGWLLLQTDDGQASSVAALIGGTKRFGSPVKHTGSHGQERFVAAQKTERTQE